MGLSSDPITQGIFGAEYSLGILLFFWHVLLNL